MVVYVAPIMHTEADPAHSIELSRRTRQRLGLDASLPSWLIVDEANRFVWRGVDVVPVSPDEDHFGPIDEKLFVEAKARFVAGVRTGRARSVDRDTH